MTKKMTKALLIVLSVLMISVTIFAEDTKTKEITFPITRPATFLTNSFVYSQTYNIMGRPVQLSMDIIQPFYGEPKKLPTVLFITGGGFMDAPSTKFIAQRVDMARAGYVVASIDYTTVPMIMFPQIIEEAKSAVRYLRANAEKFGIDPDRIAVMGESAGGYLANMLGTTNRVKEFDKGDNLDQSSDVQAAVSLYGISDLTTIGSDFSDEVIKKHTESHSAPEAMLLFGTAPMGGGAIADNIEMAKNASPLHFVSKDDPAFLIMNGDKDVVVSPSQSTKLHEALVEQGVDSTHYIIKGAGHAMAYWYQPEVMDIIIKFLDDKLKK